MVGEYPSRVLVTGGTGFVGRRLIARLLAERYTVRAAYRATRPADTGDVKWVHVPDVGPDTEWHEALADASVVFHLAGLAHQLERSQASLAAEYDRVNAYGTQRLAQCVIARGTPARIVFLSSIGAVCSTSAAPVRVDTPEKPQTGYGRSKLLGETLLKEVCGSARAVEWCVVRAPLVYGPEAPGNLKRLVRLVRRGLPLPLGRATARRSMVFVDNLVDVLVLCGRSPAASGETFLVADDETVSIAELVALMAEIERRRLVLLNVPPRALSWLAALADRFTARATDASGRYTRAVELLFSSLVIDTSIARERLRWQPPHSLRAGMAATMSRQSAGK